jgi:predicted dehydrogenase
MNKIKVGVVGVGHLGKLHAQLYKEVPQAQLVGIFDIDQEKAQKVGEEINIQVFTDLNKLLQEVEAVNIVTPTSTHKQVALAALDHDCHIFIEKPIMETEEEASAIIARSKEKNKILQVGHIERFNPAMLALADVDIKPVFIESHRLAPFNPRGTDVAVILDLMIHDLDLILMLVKSSVAQVDAHGVGVISKTIDIANARIRFENGCIANVTASRISAKKMRKMRIFQANAYISLDFVSGISEIYYSADWQDHPFQDGTLAVSLGQINVDNGRKEIKYNQLKREGVNPLVYELTAFIESINAKLPPVVSGESGLQALRLAKLIEHKISESSDLIQKNILN